MIWGCLDLDESAINNDLMGLATILFVTNHHYLDVRNSRSGEVKPDGISRKERASANHI